MSTDENKRRIKNGTLVRFQITLKKIKKSAKETREGQSVSMKGEKPRK